MTQAAQDLSESLSSAAEAAERALVHVSASCRRGASGSVFNDEGVILTTARALAGRERLEIAQGEQSVEAKVIGFDAATDIGVARTEAPLGEPPRWASAPARLGALVLSSSRPGRGARVRLGVVSQVGDAWHTFRGGRIERYVETDLAPEPGFSGGLGFDAQGAALGMSSAAAGGARRRRGCRAAARAVASRAATAGRRDAWSTAVTSPGLLAQLSHELEELRGQDGA